MNRQLSIDEEHQKMKNQKDYNDAGKRMSLLVTNEEENSKSPSHIEGPKKKMRLEKEYMRLIS
jgi:hypothetical protein